MITFIGTLYRRRYGIFLALYALLPPLAHPLPSPVAEYYGELGCAHCDTFSTVELPAAEAESGVKVELRLYDILSAEGYTRCEERLAELGYSFRIFPVLVLGASAYQGNAAIEANLLPALKRYAETGTFGPRYEDAEKPSDERKSAGMRWAALPIFLAGLIDGINPCAFTTLLFFMSYLSLRGGSRRRMAAAGLAFAAGVFLSYFLIGFGLFNALRLGSGLPVARLALRIAVSAITAAFCALTVRDIAMFKAGKSSGMSLKLPDAVRLRINSSIRGGMGSTLFIAGVFATGVVVSVLELACTGQVYFPAISFMVQTDATALGIGSLALYNLAFITPLLAVLILSIAGIGNDKARVFFMRHLVLAKASQAVLFAALAVLIWVY